MHISKLLVVSGLALDMAGAFLLGVEAIRLDNIQELKVRVLTKLHSHAQSPRLYFEGDEEHNRQVAALGSRLSETWPPGLFMGLHWIAGAIVLGVLFSEWPRLVDLYVGYWVWVVGLRLYFSIPLGAWSAGVSLGLMWSVGEIVHVFVEKILSGSLWLVDFVLKKTATGTSGVIGIVTLILGFACQALGALLG